MEAGSTPYVAAFGVGTTVAMLTLLRVAQRVTSPTHTVAKDFAAPNAARRLVQVGDVLAIFLVAAAVVKNCVAGQTLRHDLVWAGAYGVLGLVLVQGAGHVGTRMLFGAKLPAEIERGNAAAGLAAGANFVATGILASRAVAGSDLRGIGLALVFFALAVATHALFVALFRALTTYDDAEQIRGENVAAAISYAGMSIAVAITVARGVEGDFHGWAASLRGYAGVVACSLALFPVRQIVVQGLLLGARPSLRGGVLDRAVGEEREGAMAALEAVTYVATSLAIATLA